MSPSSPADDAATEAVREAQRTIVNAEWQLFQELALGRLATVRGLACTPLFPVSAVIQVVACDGELLGRARRHGKGRAACWIAVDTTTARELSAHRHLSGAARALARHHGLRRWSVRRMPCPAVILADLGGTTPVAEIRGGTRTTRTDESRG